MRAKKDAVLSRLASFVYGIGLTPSMITALGLCCGVASGFLFMSHTMPFAFVFWFLSIFCDLLDGTIARKFNLKTRFGIVFDSVADRASESAVVLGAFFGGIIKPLGFVAIVGSTLLFGLRTLSYVQGLNTNYVLFGRVERLVFIMFGLATPVVTISTFCFVIAGGFGIASSFQIATSLGLFRKDR